MSTTDPAAGPAAQAPIAPARQPVFRPKILTTLAAYDRRTALGDLAAGLTVSMVALPLGIAIAIASGARPEAGIVTTIVAGFLISALGGSRVQIGGPTGAFIVVVASVIQAHGFDGLLVATAMAGVILIAAALTRVAALIRFIPEAVINGFTMGIAAVIAASQLRDLTGIELDTIPAEFVPKIALLWEARGTASLPVIGAGMATIAIIVVIRRLSPRIPGPVIAVAIVSAAVALTGLDVDTLTSRYGSIAAGVPAPRLPDVTPELLVGLLPSALIIAFLAGVESLLSAMVADRMSGNAHRTHMEVFAQGVANCVAPLFGGLPATGAIARTATNIRAGGKTPVAGIAHALFVLVFVVTLAPLVGMMAMPALAGILMLTAWNMAEPHRIAAHFKRPAEDVVLLLLTLCLTVFADLTIAIGAGVALGLAFRLRRRYVPPARWATPRR